MIINLTQHDATIEQRAAGVVAINIGTTQRIRLLLSFEQLPTPEEIQGRADELAELAASFGAEKALIGGAPYLMGPLEAALINRRVTPVYSFTERVSVEEELPDGSVRKTQSFRHIGFVSVQKWDAHSHSWVDPAQAVVDQAS